MRIPVYRIIVFVLGTMLAGTAPLQAAIITSSSLVDASSEMRYDFGTGDGGRAANLPFSAINAEGISVAGAGGSGVSGGLLHFFNTIELGTGVSAGGVVPDPPHLAVSAGVRASSIGKFYVQATAGDSLVPFVSGRTIIEWEVVGEIAPGDAGAITLAASTDVRIYYGPGHVLQPGEPLTPYFYADIPLAPGAVHYKFHEEFLWNVTENYGEHNASAFAHLAVVHNAGSTGASSLTLTDPGIYFEIVPEPSALALSAFGALGLLIVARRHHVAGSTHP